MADGSRWILPSPPELTGQGTGAFDAEYEALVRGTSAAEDRSDLLRAELALAIFLLGWNYDLEPEEFAEILECPAGHPVLAAMQRAFHEMTLDHARALRARTPTRVLDGGSAVATGLLGVFSRLGFARLTG